MSKPIIAVDIDDVLAHNVPDFIRWSNQKYGLQLTIEDYEEDWARMWQIDYDEMVRRNTDFHSSNVMEQYAHHDQAVPVLTELKKRYELVIITSRPTRLQKMTLEWLSRKFPDLFDAVHFAGMWDVITEDSHHATKADLAKELGISYLIDDQPKHVLAVAELGIEAVLFGDYPWNRETKLPDGVVRCVDWEAIQEYFDGRS